MSLVLRAPSCPLVAPYWANWDKLVLSNSAGLCTCKGPDYGRIILLSIFFLYLRRPLVGVLLLDLLSEKATNDLLIR